MVSNIDQDIIMKENINNNIFSFFYHRPKKRTYLEMLYNTNQIYLNDRINNYKIKNRALKDSTLIYQNQNHCMNIENKNSNSLIKNFNEYTNLNEVKLNLNIKKSVVEYDEEYERKMVENYYRIKNAELNRLRFGS